MTATTTTRRSMHLPRQTERASTSVQPTPEAESSPSDVDSHDSAESGESDGSE